MQTPRRQINCQRQAPPPGKDSTLFSRRLKMRIACSTAIAVAALSAGAASANADVLATCDGQSLSKPFTPWLDVANYTPLSGGDFESGADGWSLSGGARVVAGNESFNVGGADDASSLRIPAGGSATSPGICANLAHPTMRFFAKRNSGGLLGLSTMRVDVLFETVLGIQGSLPVGVVTASSNWQPTLPMTVVANLLNVLPTADTPVRFRFSPMLGGDWSLDDVYVDPFQR